MNIYWDSFKTFFKIGIFTLGGGYAMIPLIEEEVVNKKQWVSKDEMLDLIAIAQSCPGVFAINIATFIGYKLNKTRGAIAIFFSAFKENRIIAAMFRGIRPAVVALIAVPTFNLGKRAQLNRYTIWIPIVCALAIWALGVSPIYIIMIAAVGGYIYGRINKTSCNS